MALDGFDSPQSLEPPGSFGSDFAQLAKDASFVQIIQIEGPAAERVEVILSSRSMPYQNVPWEVSQRSKLTWYPGNPVATQQILGPEEMPTTMNGVWKDRFIQGTIAKNGDVAAIDTAERAVLLFHDLTRAGKAVRVQWLSETRTGIIKRFKPTWIRAQDVEWEIEFEWSGRNDEEALRSAAQTPPASDVLNGSNNLEDLFTLIPDVARRLEASLVETIHGIRDRVQRVFGVLRAYETLVNLPATLQGTLEADVASLRNELQEFGHRLDSGRSSTFDPETSSRVKFGSSREALVQRSGVGSPAQVPGEPSGFASKTSANAITSADVEELKFEVWRRSTARQAYALLFQLQQQATAAAARKQPGTTTTRQMRQGETLYSIAADVYGSPDFANFLANANRINTAIPSPGTWLRIPPRPFGATLNVEPNVAPKQPCEGR